MVLKITLKQSKHVNALIRRLCCNCDDGNCLLLDDGEPHSCVQLISKYGIYCNYFKNSVLPLDKELYTEITNAAKGKRCVLCALYFLPKAKNQRYCPQCAEKQRRLKATERQRRKRASPSRFTCRIRLAARLLQTENKVSNTANTLSPKMRDKSVTKNLKEGNPLNKFHTTLEAETYVFYKVPKTLFTDGKYRSVSTDAKMLYGLLLDRMHLSVKNGWTDRYGRVYQYFTVKQAQELLRFGHEKICRLFSIGSGRLNSSQKAGSRKTEYHLRQEILTSVFRIS